MGYIETEPDGELTFNFINPDNDGFVSEKKRIVNLGLLPVFSCQSDICK